MKSMKKLVLVGLVLLASVVVLAGCKNDSVPEVTPAKLVSITVTPPTRTVYSVGESFDSTGMVVTATYDDGKERTVEGTITGETSSLTESAGINKGVTVSYTEGDIEKTDTFTVDVASYQFTETVQDADSSYTGTMSGGTYKKYGDWPQTIMGAGVTVGSGTLVRGGLSYHVGSDGNYYVKAEEKAAGTGDEYKYSDGTQAGQNGTSTQWFKVEPIVWRVLTESYNSTGKALLLAENILTGGIPYYSVYNVKRTIEGAEISPNNYEHSQIRAFLNGLSYAYKNSAEQIEKSEYKDAGFLQTAFTEKARNDIALTTVKNSARSTNPDSNGEQWNSGKNEYACVNTTDKIFLLSAQEATKEDYGFAEYNVYVGDSNNTETSTRIRVTTDYAKATGAYQDFTAGYGGWWWLRSPHYDSEIDVRLIRHDGYASYIIVSNMEVGIVPALSISLEGNWL